MTSKTVFELAKPAREKHLHRKRKFSTRIFGDVHLYQSSNERWIVPRKQHPVHALQDITSDLDVAADYCKTLRIGGVDGHGYVTGEYGDYDSEQALTVMEDLYPQLQALVPSQLGRKMEYMQHDGLHKLPYTIALTSLRNIETLELTNCSDFFRRKLRDVMQIMISSHNHLKRVEMFGNHHQRGEHLEVLAMFAKIPSVRMIWGLQVLGKEDDLWQWPSDFYRSSIEEIHFECSAVDSFLFSRLFDTTNILKIFYYDHDDFLNSPPEYEPRRVVTYLRSSAKESLESLTLVNLSGTGTDSGTSGDEAILKISLRPFLVLRHIAIDCSVFIDAKGTNDVPTLVDMLPATLEALELYNPAMDKHIPAMFRDLRDLKEDRLPRLRCISLQSGMKISQEMRLDCEELGIQLAFVDAPKQKWSHLYS
ncbi:MAG: hypothetical protein Q9221_008008 [Calogaya cf. arnoldii]